MLLESSSSICISTSGICQRFCCKDLFYDLHMTYSSKIWKTNLSLHKIFCLPDSCPSWPLSNQNLHNPFADTPEMPEEIQVTEVGPDFIAVTWKAPSNDGGSEIVGYVVEKKEAGRRTFHTVAKVMLSSQILTIAVTLIE